MIFIVNRFWITLKKYLNKYINHLLSFIHYETQTFPLRAGITFPAPSDIIITTETFYWSHYNNSGKVKRII